MILITAKKDSPVTGYERIFALLGFSGSYSTGGDTLDFTHTLNAAGIPVAQPSQLPLCVNVIAQGTDGLYCEYIPGTTLANAKLRLWQAGGTEVAATTYGAPWTTTAVVYLEIVLKDSDR